MEPSLACNTRSFYHGNILLPFYAALTVKCVFLLSNFNRHTRGANLASVDMFNFLNVLFYLSNHR